MLRENLFRAVLSSLLFSFSPSFAQVGSDPGQEVYQEWVSRYNGPSSGEDVPVALAADISGNVFVTGYSQGLGTSKDIVALKYSASGNLL